MNAETLHRVIFKARADGGPHDAVTFLVSLKEGRTTDRKQAGAWPLKEALRLAAFWPQTAYVDRFATDLDGV